MIIIDRTENESIDRFVKRYKRKHRNLKVHKEFRRRKEFVKPSVRRRKEILSAIYKLQRYGTAGK